MGERERGGGERRRGTETERRGGTPPQKKKKEREMREGRERLIPISFKFARRR